MSQNLHNKQNSSSLNAYFEKIYNKYFKLVFFVCLAEIENEEIAKDLTQDTFVLFFKAIMDGTIIKNPKYYLCNSIKNIAINYLKHDVKTISFNDDINAIQSNDCWTINAQNKDFLDEWKNILNNEERSLIEMHYIDGLTFKTISSKTGKPLNSVKSTCRRAIKKIQKRIKYEK